MAFKYAFPNNSESHENKMEHEMARVCLIWCIGILTDVMATGSLHDYSMACLKLISV